MDSDLPAGYNFKQYKTPNEPYRLCQIYLGRDYRAVVMFPHGRSEAYWIHVFKKEGQREPQEIELAKSRAKANWNAIKGGS